MPAWSSLLAGAAALAVGTSLVQAATYDLVEKSAGLTFFNGWTFYECVSFGRGWSSSRC